MVASIFVYFYLNSLVHVLSPYDLMIIGNEKRVGREGGELKISLRNFLMAGNTLFVRGSSCLTSPYPSISLADN